MKPGPHFWTLSVSGVPRQELLSLEVSSGVGTPGPQLLALTVLHLRQLGTGDGKTAQMA